MRTLALLFAGLAAASLDRVEEKTGAIAVVDVSALVATDSSDADRRAAALQLSKSFARTGFALVQGHPVRAETIATLRRGAYAFFEGDEKHAYDKGLGYGHGGYVAFGEAAC